MLGLTLKVVLFVIQIDVKPELELLNSSYNFFKNPKQNRFVLLYVRVFFISYDDMLLI